MGESYALGVMSGSSLDGLDFALCRFVYADEQDSFYIQSWEIIEAETFELSVFWQDRLLKAYQTSAKEMWLAHNTFGKYIGEQALLFLRRTQIVPDFIASHGHTVFHEPQNHMTLQIGNGAAIAAVTGLPVISDFRSTDVALGGQGAPMIPIAESKLFSGFPLCLNIGGITNLSARIDGHYVAFDISPANQVMNKLASQSGQAYDQDGLTARSGKLQPELNTALKRLDYFSTPYPKSLDNNWVMRDLWPVIKSFDFSAADKLNTFCEFIADRLSAEIKNICTRENTSFEGAQMLVTGGGALNQYLVECISERCSKENGVEVVLPDLQIIEFKEALLMALAGLLRVKNIPNFLSSVTGASMDSIGGCIYQGTKQLI